MRVVLYEQNEEMANESVKTVKPSDFVTYQFGT